MVLEERVSRLERQMDEIRKEVFWAKHKDRPINPRILDAALDKARCFTVDDQ